ncbi:MAG: histidine kinase [Bacteroidetes bacterium]|nr:histidine kinase [Bacteroidota bacterium]MCL1968433.1 histidine kinase [Bacteroidota bacterium]
MKIAKKKFRLNTENFLSFKIVLWIVACLSFLSVSILIPSTEYGIIKDLLILFTLFVVINFHTSYLYQKIVKKSKYIYFILLTASILCCVSLEILLYNKSCNDIYAFMDKRRICLFFGIYIFIRDFALFIFFFWVEHFNRIFLLYKKKEKIHKEEIALLIEKQEFEKNFSRKKLLPHYFFNILEYLNFEFLSDNSDREILDKVKFILYYFLVDAEKEAIELDKELVFYKYYIDLENIRHQKNVLVNFNVLGEPENFIVIPLLFEPLIGNAMKYTKHDGTGWVNITVNTQNFPVLQFNCKNNYAKPSSSIVSSDNGLKILEQRLNLCYKNKYTLLITQNCDSYEVALSIEVV